MKQNIFLNSLCVSVAVVILLLQSGCSKDDNAYYNPGTMVTDVSQAYMYYFIIFREAENAWAQVHENGYNAGNVDNTESRTVKYVITDVNDSVKRYSIDVDLKNYTWNSAVLSGKLTIDLAVDSSYTKKDKATISLTKFFINRQEVKGFSTIIHTQNEETDQYSYVLASGSIYSVDGKEILITSAVTGGTLLRAEGSATPATPEDDIWTFSGAMTGNIRNTASLKYSNTVAVGTIKDAVPPVTVQYPPVFDWNCSRKAQQGVCKLTVGKQEILYDYGDNCESTIEVVTVTHNDH